MNPLILLLILIALATQVAGQLLLKHAMEFSIVGGLLHRRFVFLFSLGTLVMAISFFLSLGLLQRLDLSYLYPFQGLSVVLITAAAAVHLREKLTPQLILGSTLITAGVVLVSIS